MGELSRVSDAILTELLKAAVSNERRCSAEVQRLLEEAGRRGIHESAGYQSLLDFCKDFLGYSETAASQRLRRS